MRHAAGAAALHATGKLHEAFDRSGDAVAVFRRRCGWRNLFIARGLRRLRNGRKRRRGRNAGGGVVGGEVGDGVVVRTRRRAARAGCASTPAAAPKARAPRRSGRETAGRETAGQEIAQLLGPYAAAKRRPRYRWRGWAGRARRSGTKPLRQRSRKREADG